MSGSEGYMIDHLQQMCKPPLSVILTSYRGSSESNEIGDAAHLQWPWWRWRMSCAAYSSIFR
jgi:hypothetical protein